MVEKVRFRASFLKKKFVLYFTKILSEEDKSLVETVEVFFRGPGEAVKLQPRHVTRLLFYCCCRSIILLKLYVALLYDDTYGGNRTPSMDPVFVKPYGLPLRRSIRFARKYRVVAALAHVARHVAKG